MANRSFVVQYIIKARDQFSAATARATKTLKTFDSRINKTKTSIFDFSKKMRNVGAGLTLAVTTPIALLAKSLKDVARDAIETESKFEAVFGGISKSANKGAADLAKNYGLAQDEAKKFLSNTGDLLTGFGFAQDKAYDLSMQVNQLAVDLGSFQNVDSARASDAITKALLGEREMMKSLGVAILEADVKAKMYQQRQEGLRFATERQAKAQATMALILEQTKNAQGDYARTSQGLANQEKATAAAIRDLKVSFGKLLIPVMLKANKIIQSMTSWLSGLTDSQKKMTVVVVAVAAAIAPLLFLIGGFVTILPIIASGFAILSSAMLPLVAIGAGIYAIYKNWGSISSVLVEKTTGLQKSLSYLVSKLQEVWKIISPVLIPALKMVGQIFSVVLVSGIDILISALTLVIDTVSHVVNGFTILIDTVKSVFSYLGQLASFAVPDWLKGLFGFGGGGDISVNGAPNQAQAPVNIASSAKIDANVNIGLDKGLKQTSEPVVNSQNTRRADVGVFSL